MARYVATEGNVVPATVEPRRARGRCRVRARVLRLYMNRAPEFIKNRRTTQKGKNY